MPGVSNLDFTLSLQDARGQIVVGSEEHRISHLVQLFVLPRDCECTSIASCDEFKLQSIESRQTSGTQATTSLKLDFNYPAPLKYCEVGVEEVQVRLFLVSGEELDVGAASQSEDGQSLLAMLQKSISSLAGACVSVCTYIGTHVHVHVH